MSEVALFSTLNDPMAATRRAIDAVCSAEALFAAKRVLVKPGYGGVLVEAELVRGVVTRLLEAGARVTVGEAAFSDGPEKMAERFEKSGARVLCQQLGVPLVDLNADEEVKVDVGGVTGVVGIARTALEAEAIVNIAHLHNHPQTLATLALKNIKGIMGRDQKKLIHRRGLERGIVDLNDRFPSALGIIDAVYGVDLRSRQDPMPMNLVAASTDLVALDAVGCRLMGYDPARVKHVTLAARQGLGSLTDIRVLGEDVEAHARQFSDPRGPLNFLRYQIELLADDACSGCYTYLREAYRSLPPGFDEQMPDILAYVGPTVARRERAGKREMAVGDCAARRLGDVPAARGCPPDMETLVEALKEMASCSDLRSPDAP